MKYKLPTGFLSFSAMQLLQSCQKRYVFRYVDKIPTEWQKTEAMDRGWAFHKLVEDNDVTSDGLSTISKRLAGDHYEVNRVLVAFGAYKAKLDAGDLPKLAIGELKLVSEEHQFLGFIDRWKIDEDNGFWMLGEMKTSQRFDMHQWLMAERSFQMALYLGMSGEWAAKNYLTREDFQGFSHERIILSAKKPAKATKTKAAETPDDFKWRIKDDTRVYHKIILPPPETVAEAMHAFETAKKGSAALLRTPQVAVKNQQACFAYNRPCEYFAHCWGLSPEQAIEQHPESTIDYSEPIED